MDAKIGEQVFFEETDRPYSILEAISGVDGVDKLFFFASLKFCFKKNNRKVNRPFQEAKTNKQKDGNNRV